MAKHYYYRCDSASEIGKKLKKLLNDCMKAERAQMDYGRKCGAESIVPVDDNFEGGVIGVTFADDDKVNKTVWKEIVKDRDGKTIWRPNCECREGVVISKNDRYRPSDTATRLFDYKQRTFAEVKHLYTAQQWYDLGRLFLTGHELTGNREEDEALVGKLLSEKRFIKYVELYRTDTDKRIREMSKLQREAINLEHRRRMLPVVTPLRVFSLLKADAKVDIPKGKHFAIVKPETPTFWEYADHWYIGCVFPCKAEGLTEISSEAYTTKLTDLLRVQRDMEALAKSEAKGS